MLAPQVRDIALIILATEHGVEVPQHPAHGPEKRTAPAAGGPDPALLSYPWDGPVGRRARPTGHRRVDCQCAFTCAAPGSFTSPFSISSSHSRCTSFSAAVGRNPRGAKMREGSSGDSVVSAEPARQAR